MKKIVKILKERRFLFIGIIIGGIIFGSGAYATTVSASNVSYNNSSSKVASTNVQGAIDALSKTADSK